MKGKVEEKTSEKDGLKVQDVLDEMELSSETIVSKINGEIVIEESVIEDGDEVEFIQIIYGG
jgi:sulfur carrier protein